MTRVPYELEADDPATLPIGLIVLQTDETLEPDFKRLWADMPNPLYVSRIRSNAEVSTETLGAMEADLAAAADLLPKARHYPAVGYGCTSASSVIGSDKVEELVQRTCNVETVTNPLRATIACAADQGVSRFALLSPYVEDVNVPLRAGFASAGISTDVFATFAEPNEANVVRISTRSIIEAATALGRDASVDAVFLSCTNLRTLEALPLIQKQIGKPVLSSNQALAWHLRALVSG